MDIDKERLTKMAAELTAQRDALVTDANRQIAYLNGQIALLEELTAPPPDGVTAATDEPAAAVE
jgi:hypothetical protein